MPSEPRPSSHELLSLFHTSESLDWSLQTHTYIHTHIMKVFLLLGFLIGVSMAQRSPYAPRPVGYPDVLNRFKGTEDDLPNRLGGVNSTSDPGPLKTPEGSIGDPYLVNRLPEWPREHQPFWYLNQQHIMNHRGQAQPARGGSQGTTQQGQGNRQDQATRQPQGQANRQTQVTRQQQGQGNRQQ